MASDHLPALCRHRHNWRCYLTLNDREAYLGTERMAAKIGRDRVIAKWLAIGRQLDESGDLTVAQLLAAYRTYAESYYVKDGKPTTEIVHIRGMSKLLRTNYGDQPALTFSPLALIGLQDRMVSSGWSRSYCNMIRSKLVRMFRWAASRELLPVSIFQSLATVPGLMKGRTKARE